MNEWKAYLKRKAPEFDNMILDLCCEAVVLLKSGNISREEFDGTMDHLCISHPLRAALFEAYDNLN